MISVIEQNSYSVETLREQIGGVGYETTLLIRDKCDCYVLAGSFLNEGTYVMPLEAIRDLHSNKAKIHAEKLLKRQEIIAKLEKLVEKSAILRSQIMLTK